MTESIPFTTVITNKVKPKPQLNPTLPPPSTKAPLSPQSPDRNYNSFNPEFVHQIETLIPSETIPSHIQTPHLMQLCQNFCPQSKMRTSPIYHLSSKKVFYNRLLNKARLQIISDNNSQKPVQSFCSIPSANSSPQVLSFSWNCWGCPKYVNRHWPRTVTPAKILSVMKSKLNCFTVTLNWGWNNHTLMGHHTILTRSAYSNLPLKGIVMEVDQTKAI